MSGVITVLNGPNLNLLGTREPDVYGSETLADVELRCVAVADRYGARIDFRQTNHEGVLVETVHELAGQVLGFVVNAASLTHTSVGIRDAFAAVAEPVVEVHISNVFAREPFRHHSYLSDIAAGVIVGCGTQGYEFAVHRVATLAGLRIGS